MYLHRAPVDMRLQRTGLSMLAQEVIRQGPFSNAIFVFVGSVMTESSC